MPAPFTELDDSEARRPGSRRETIMSLVEMLLRPDELVQGNNQQPTFEDDKDVPTVDEAHQAAGAEAFNKFQRRINNLDKELRNFSNAARQLGSSAAILSSAFHLRTRLAQISFLYRENAAHLFPRKISRAVLPIAPDVSKKQRRRMMAHLSVRHRAMPHIARPVVNDSIDLEDFPEQFEKLANEVTTFVNCLNEFPEFTDEAVNASISSFEGDLKYWANCLKEYEGQFRYPAVQRYIQDLTSEMGEHIDSITTTLSMFIEVGVPTIRFAQKHGATNLLNLSTVATFFSAVTATTLQFSFGLIETRTEHAVNSFWFLSLVFSIAAAVNSLLGLTWKQAMYRSPGHRVPWWVLIWIKRSPLAFLVISVTCFSIGLCLFTYASGQNTVTCTITTVMTAITSFGLAAVSAWFASERWAWSRHRGKKWLDDVLDEVNARFLRVTGILMIHNAFVWTSKKFKAVGVKLRGVKPALSNLAGSSSEKLNETTTVTNSVAGKDESFPASPISIAPSSRSYISDVRPASPIPAAPLVSTIYTSDTFSTPTTPDASRMGRQLWQNAIRTVKMRSQVTSNLAAISAHNQRTPRRQRTNSSTVHSPERLRAQTDLPVTVLKSRVAALVPKLKCLETTQDLAAHQALVRHLQFSPDGKFLATSSWDRTSVIFRVGDPFGSHRILAHAKGFVGQVAWAPDGKSLLTKLVRGIKIWNQDGVCTRTIDRPVYVESITWFPGGEAFLSVEGSNAVKLDLKGKVLGTYNFKNMKLHDVAVTMDRVRLLGVGPLLLSPSGLRPSKSKVEKRLAVFNMETGQIENVTPVLNEVRDITLARNTRNGTVALVSYENKAPPQLWKMELIKDQKTNNNPQSIARLTLRHTYMPKTPVDFAGPSYFGGKNDELVLCAGKAGDIHIWDRESGALLHHVRAQALGGDLTCIAWNHAAENPFMFATGSHDGAVRIWTKPPEFDPPSAVPSNRDSMVDMTRTSSPYGIEFLESINTSPVTQAEFAAAVSSRSASPESMTGPLIRKERAVAFSDDLNAVSGSSSSHPSPSPSQGS